MRRLSDVLKEQYGEKVYKLSLSAGCTCPNRDGTAGTGGCTFCSEGGSGDFAAAPAPVSVQIEEAKKKIAAKTDARKFIAYFQSFTNTYGDPGRLKALYQETLQRDDIVILSLGTRPDCLGDDVMEMLRELAGKPAPAEKGGMPECSAPAASAAIGKPAPVPSAAPEKPIWIELGLQTIHERTAQRINRCYPLSVFEESYRRLKTEGFAVIVHVIFGLPGETRSDMLDTVRYLASLAPPPDGVKLQMLHILRGTALGAKYEKESFPLMTMEEYADLVAESIGILPEETVIHRMTGDGPKKLLIAPDWTRDKKKVLNTINRRLREPAER